MSVDQGIPSTRKTAAAVVILLDEVQPILERLQRKHTRQTQEAMAAEVRAILNAAAARAKTL